MYICFNLCARILVNMEPSISLIVLSAAASSMEMTVCLCCTVQLVRHWIRTQDLTRFFLGFCAAVFMLESLFKVISIALHPDANLYSQMMDETLVIFSLLGQITALAYPLFILYPQRRLYLSFLLIPWGLLFIIYSLTSEWTVLLSFADLMQHIGEGNVILRLITLACFFPYMGVLIWLMPKRVKNTDFSMPLFEAYVLSVVAITLLHFSFFFTGNLVMHILHQVTISAFIYVITIFDLEDRLIPRGASSRQTESSSRRKEPAQTEMMISSEKPLWERICQAMDQEEIWRDPSLSVESLARNCGTNVLYLGNCIKQETGLGANDYINRKRIGFVCQRLDENPALSLQDVFYEAGYRARTTAWRNFREIMGLSPSEYRISKQEQR